MKLTYEISELAPYINWIYFHYAWQLHEAEAQRRQRQDAETLLSELDGHYRVYALFELPEAHADGDDIIAAGHRIPLLRQQTAPFLCLSDFVRPQASGTTDRIGLFATSVDHGLERDFDDDPYMKMMVQLLADRLAEAAAEKLHEAVRRTYWGYAPDEQLSMDDLHAERFTGIRPAIGYPSLPDTSVNFVLDEILDLKQIGIRLTESGAMKPHASVSGLMIALSEAHYFSVGRIGSDQLTDYAHRRGLPMEVVRKFLNTNL